MRTYFVNWYRLRVFFTGRGLFSEKMSTQLVGYSQIIEQYQLEALPLLASARIDTAVKGRDQRQMGQEQLMLFEPRYQPESTLTGQLQFALRYEGINLQVLALLFEQGVEDELIQWLAERPNSIYARRACFLYEWITGKSLELTLTVSGQAKYELAADPDLQFAYQTGEKNQRYRVLDNLPGTGDFCPMVRKTTFLAEAESSNLKAAIEQTLQNYDEELLRRAAAFLYLKETQDSFEVEREKPSPDKAQRFADMLRDADARQPLSEERFCDLQNAALDPRFHEYTWRHQQNWIGKDLGYRQQIDFVPARPDDVTSLMNGLVQTIEKIESAEHNDELTLDAVVLAAIVAFGFVYIHPFMDGNGRIHRYLIHDILVRAGFTPKGIIIPVSAVILANLDDYIEVLESHSRPIQARTTYNPDCPEVPATGNDAIYFRYFDATRHAEYLYDALKRTVEKDLKEEIEFLLGFDRAYRELNSAIDWPGHSLELFIRVVHQNNGELSKTKRTSHFEWMTKDEIQRAEEAVRQAFVREN